MTKTRKTPKDWNIVSNCTLLTTACNILVTFEVLKLKITSRMCRRFEPSLLPTPPYKSIPPLYLFSQPPPQPPLLTFFWQYCTNEMWFQHKNKCMRKSSSCLQGYKTILYAFFISSFFTYINMLRFSLK